MNQAPEFAHIVAVVSIFLGVFIISNVAARIRGYRE